MSTAAPTESAAHRASRAPWNIHFRGRPCWTCGGHPSGAFPDGSPRYPCRHSPSTTSALFESVPVPLDVVLTEREMQSAAECAEKRLAAAARRAMRDRLSEYSIRSHKLGAIGERAFVKWVGIPWRCTMQRFGRPDFGRVEVRTVARVDQRLVVHSEDRLDAVVVLMVADRLPIVHVRGCIRVVDARQPEWLDDPGERRPSYFVPQADLREPELPYLRDLTGSGGRV